MPAPETVANLNALMRSTLRNAAYGYVALSKIASTEHQTIVVRGK
jgi:hypothetical protein